LEIKINPEYEKLVYPLTKEQFNSVFESIKEKGLLEPITVNKDGYILDGHNRWKICNILGIECRYEIKYFKNKFEEKLYVIDVNLHRRHLTPAQRIQLALLKKPIYEEQAKHNQSEGGKGVQICTPLKRVNEIIAKDAGVSARQVSKFEFILNSIPDPPNSNLMKRVLNGSTNINKVYNQLDLQRQREDLLKLHSANSNFDSSDQLKLFRADIREITPADIPDNSVQLIFTDPQYDKPSLSFYKVLAVLAERILMEGGSLITYIGQYALPVILDYILKNSTLKYYWELAVLHSGAQMPMYSKHIRVDWKPLLWFYKGDAPTILYDIHDSIKSDIPDKLGHDWAQSTREASYCIQILTYEGQTVVDPFCGSGTTAIAALNLKRNFVGSDINADTLELARANINKYCFKTVKPLPKT
jgi:16S rRNA G966 N2-methylase RsmD